MLTQKVASAINDQIAKEFYAAHLYLSMAAYLEAQNLPGFAKWMRMQHDEERVHAMRLFDFILGNGGEVKLQGMESPPTEFEGPLDCMEKSLEHEQKVTSSINNIYELALNEKNYPAQIEMHWFIDEQVEEERTVGDIIARLRRVGNDGPALLIMDSELGSRQSEEAQK